MRTVSKLVGGLALAMLVASAAAQDKVLTVLNAGGASADSERKSFYVPFTASSGVKIVEESFNQELAKIRAQVETGRSKWDVTTLTAINEATACEEGLLEKIDWARLLDPKLFAGVGGFGRCGVPYLFVSGGIAYDGDKLKDGPRTWADFWDVKRFPGKRGMLYRAEQTFEVALMADGVEPAKVMDVLAAPGGVERALKKLEELKPHIQWWKSGAESMTLLASGEVVMTYAWNGRVASANKTNNRNFRMALGAGHVSGSQYLAIPKGTQNRAEAIRFIQFAAAPPPQAALAREINYAPANAAAYAQLTATEKATLPGEFMDRASLQRGSRYISFWVDNGDVLLQRFVRFAAQ